ncbi:ATP-dependent DNA helicase Pif1-like [Xylocopa sonorina]|uniref:ATP-dependent DNA helicase Pif1-like n=1 Tax=Xylocopa sonorina TaxID=1818115 RepID=UPI00403B037C
MAHKKSLKRTLKDLRGNKQLFGGAFILLANDFRQTLPVIPRSVPADELNACLKSSVLWRYVEKISLKTNMRVQLQQDESSEPFTKQLLDIGNGKMEIDQSTHCITLPENFCHIVKSTDELIAKAFSNLSQNYKNNQRVSERAILAAKNIDVNLINCTIQIKIPDEETTYKCIDTVVNHDESVNYPTEFFNSLDLQGMPPHILSLEIGPPIILLRNINPSQLCNGTRLSVKKLINNIIEATILKGKHQGEHVLLPRNPIIPTNTSFEFKRLQFPVRLAFAMTINKAQEQSLQVCGLNLVNPCFSYGQLYVGCSRVGKPSNLFILAPDRKTNNVVYLQALLR